MNRSLAIVPTLVFALTAAGCAHDYAYVPATNSNASMAGRPAADYAIPPESPRGDVRIASYGIVHVSPQNMPDEDVAALHLRVIIINNADVAWTFDTSAQRLNLEGRGPSAPAFASASGGAHPPLVTIPPREKRVADLFFPLPADLQKADELPTFDAAWSVNIGDRTIAQQTPFERINLDTDYNNTYASGPYDYGDAYYWGPSYWYNPAYVGLGFVGGVALAPHFYGGPVVVHRAPFHGRFGGGHAVGGHGGGRR